jgi:hypothetical protein
MIDRLKEKAKEKKENLKEKLSSGKQAEQNG